MTSKKKTPTILREPSSKMSENPLRNVLSVNQTKTINVLGNKLTIRKLTLAETKEIRLTAQQNEDSDDAEENFEVLKKVLMLGCPDAQELSNEEFNAFPIETLNDIARHIMKFSGLDQPGK